MTSFDEKRRYVVDYYASWDLYLSENVLSNKQKIEFPANLIKKVKVKVSRLVYTRTYG